MSMKIGMIGLDTSHAVELAKLFHDPENPFHIPGVNLAKAFSGGSAKVALSRDRVEGFTKTVAENGAEIVSSLDELEGLDAYLLESVDGDQHLEQFERISRFGKPVFLDKPLACSYADAKAILRLSKERRAPVMTASGMRCCAGVGDLVPEGEKVLSAEGFGPMGFLPDYRDYFWYGIHTADTVFRYLGRGCAEVRVVSLGEFDTIFGVWADGRLGICSGNRSGGYRFGARVLTEKTQYASVMNSDIPYLFKLASAIVEFFRTGVSPIDPEESLEVIAFLEAASRSRAAHGKTIKLADLNGSVNSENNHHGDFK